MKKRPDIAIVLMACFALGTSVLFGTVINRSGFQLDVAMLVANFTFAICSYLTTLAFDNVLHQPTLEKLLNAYAKKEIDVSGLFNAQTPGPIALGEKIWSHKPVSQCVLMKTYSVETQSAHDKIVAQLLASLFLLFIASATAILVGRGITPISTPGQVSGVAISILTLVVTFVFAIVRVYWPLLEIAQRNLSLVREAESSLRLK